MNEMVRCRRPAPERVVRGTFPVFPVVGVACTVFGAVGHQVGLGAAICATLLVVAVAVTVHRLLTTPFARPFAVQTGTTRTGEDGVDMRFDMGDTTLSTLARKTSGSTQSLGGLVRQLVVAAQPLEGRMNGAGRRAFDAFKLRADEIAADLDRGLGSVNEGQVLLDRAFRDGDDTMASTSTRAMGAANLDSTRFRG